MSDTNWASVQWKPNTYFIFDCSYWKKGRISIFLTIFRRAERTRNTFLILNIMYSFNFMCMLAKYHLTWACVKIFSLFSLKLRKLYFNHHLELLLWNLLKDPFYLASIMGTRNWKKLENNISCLQLWTKITAGIIVQWSQLLLGLSTNCWPRWCSLSLLTLLSGHYFVTDGFETTTVLIFLQGGIIISVLILKQSNTFQLFYI